MNEHQTQLQQDQAPPFIHVQKLSLREYGYAGLVLLASLIIFRWNAIKQISTAFLGGYEADSGLYIFLTQSNCYDLFSQPWFSTKAFFPYSLTLAWSDNFILPGLLACPFLKLGWPLALVYNLLLLLGIFLNGFLTFKLCHFLGATFSSALIFGATTVLTATLSGQLGHPQLQFIFFLPLAWLLLFSYFAQPRASIAFFLGLVICLSFLTTVYYAIYLTLSISIISFALLLLRPRQFKAGTLFRLLGYMGLGLLPMIPFLLPYFNVRLAFGARGLHEPAAFAATFLSYFSAPPTSFLYSLSSGLSHAEAHLFPGLITILLAGLATWRCFTGAQILRRGLYLMVSLMLSLFLLTSFFATTTVSTLVVSLLLWGVIIVGLFLLARLGGLERSLQINYLTNRNLMAIFLLLAGSFFALSFGPLAASVNEVILPSPYHVLSKAWPGLNSLRATGRMGIVVILALLVVASLAFSYLQRSFPVFVRFTPVIFVLGLVEQFTPIYPLQSATPPPSIIKEIVTRQAPTEALLFLPFTAALDRQGQVASWGNFARYNVNYMNWAINLPGPIVNGYSGQRSKIIKSFPLQMKNFPDLRSLYIAQRLAGLRYIAYISRNNPAFDKNIFEQNLRKYGNHLRLIAIDQDDNYLLEIIGHAPLDEEFSLMVPANNTYQLSFSLQATLQDAPGLSITVTLPNPKQTDQTLDLALPLDGLWHQYQLTVPKTSGQVSPNIMRFKTKASETILISNSTIKPLENMQ